MIRLRTQCALAVGLVLSAAACGDDDDAPPRPRPPPTLALASVTSAGGPTWVPDGDACVELGTDPAATVVVTVALTNFVLRPPGACGGQRPCGTVVLLLDGDQVAESSTTALSVGFTGAGLQTGQYLFRVELRDQDGEPVLDKEQLLIGDEIALDVRAPGGCTGTTDGGIDAASDGGADAESDASPPDADLDAPADAPEDAPADGPTGDAADAAADVTGG